MSFEATFHASGKQSCPLATRATDPGKSEAQTTPGAATPSRGKMPRRQRASGEGDDDETR